MKTFQGPPVKGRMLKTCFNSVTVNDFLPLWKWGGGGVGPGPYFHTGVGNMFEMPHPLVLVLVNSVYIQLILAGINFVRPLSNIFYFTIREQSNRTAFLIAWTNLIYKRRLALYQPKI
jgi:hypothetical protein